MSLPCKHIGRPKPRDVSDNIYYYVTLDLIDGENKMSENVVDVCKHEYSMGYISRLPIPFFKGVPCDHCGKMIKLSILWQIIYYGIDIFGLIILLNVSGKIVKLINIQIFGNDFWLFVLLWIPLFYCLQLFIMFILRFAKWVER